MDVPSDRVAAAGGQADDILPALESIRRTGHRLDRQGGSVQFRLRPVGGVDLHPGEVIGMPLDNHPGAVRCAERGVDNPVRAGYQVREGVIDLGPTEWPTGAEVKG